ncbi:MAG: hypothetical protein QNJ33_03470 [Crocosphaera sp.]|nr:hypothetical protein [Crocosphaera sp.]
MNTDTSVNNTLLAFLLALKELDCPLTTAEKERFSQVFQGRLIDSSPEVWTNLIQPALQKILQTNSAFYHRFQDYKLQLDSLDEQPPGDLLPTEATLANIAPLPKTTLNSFPIPVPQADNRNTYEISNMVYRVINTPEPTQTANKLGLDSLSQWLANRCKVSV